MKHVLQTTLSLGLFFLSLTLKSQFGNPVYVDTLQQGGTEQIAAADMDGDGYEDLVIIRKMWPNDEILLYKNNKSSGFLPPGLVFQAQSTYDIASIAIEDMNSDGKKDILFTDQVSLQWLENGANGFTRHMVDSALDFTTKVLLADFNADGKLDILSLQHVEIVMYLQDSNVTFPNGVVIHDSTEFYAICAADFDKNGSIDVAVGSGGFDIFLNDGSANFTEIADQGHNSLVFGLEAGDLDNDGDNDLVVWETLQGLKYYTNDSVGHFAIADTVVKATDVFRSYILADLNLDGKTDLYTTHSQRGAMFWLENKGGNQFEEQDTFHVQTGQIISQVGLCDVNRDGKNDPVWGSGIIAFHLNNNIGVGIPNLRLTDFRVYPNPSGGAIFIRAENGSNFAIYDISGKCIATGTVGSEPEALPILKPGLYVVKLFTRDNELTGSEKLVVY